MRRLVCCAVFGLMFNGCIGSDEPPIDPAYTEISPKELPVSCAASDNLRRAVALHQVVARGVNELITCGAVQHGVGKGILVGVAKSNPDVLVPAFADQLVTQFGFPNAKLDHRPDGSHRMAIQGFPTASFDLRFDDPAGKRLEPDVLRLDSYLRGVTVKKSMTAQQMVLSQAKRNRYELHWTKKGPLAALLAGTTKLANPLVFELSANQLLLLALGQLDVDELGPMAALYTLGLSSSVRIPRDYRDIRSTFEVATPSVPIKTMLNNKDLTFATFKVAADDGVASLRLLDHKLVYVERAKLGGWMKWVIEADGWSATVRDDFGTGAAYPKSTWACTSKPAANGG